MQEYLYSYMYKYIFTTQHYETFERIYKVILLTNIFYIYFYYLSDKVSNIIFNFLVSGIRLQFQSITAW